MSTTFHTPPGCESIKMSDGTVYRSNRNNKVTVERHHADEISTSCQVKYGYMDVAPHIFTDCDGKVCQGCGFHAFLFTNTCPRCGSTEFVLDSEVENALQPV